MSGLLPHRSAVFLDEMGVGVQWRLRGRAAVAPAADAFADASRAEAAFVDAAPPVPEPDVAAAVPVDAPVAAVAGAIEPPSAPRTSSSAAVVSGVRVLQPEASHVPASPARDERAAAPPATAPQPAAARAAQPPAQTAAAESAWDDAPTAPSATAPRPAAAAPSAAPQPAAGRAAQPPARTASAESAWDDEAAAAPLPTAAASAALQPPAAARSASPASRPAASGPVPDEEIAEMDWPTLRASVDSCTRCRLCQSREAAVNGRGDEQASWLILDAAPNPDDEEYAEPVTGNPGRLLDNMLRAVNQSTQKGAYITTLVKCRPQNEDGSQRAPTQEELSACRPYLERELQLTQAKVVVAIGHAAGKGLLGAAARGRIMLHGETPVVATFHPADLLKRPEEKAKAWEDLCLAKAAHAGRR